MLNNTLNNRKIQVVNMAKSTDGYMTEQELEWLYDNARGESVEIGSYKGRSTIALGLKLKHSNGHLTCVDCWYNEGIFHDFKQNMKDADITVSMLKMRSVEAAKHIADNSLDFIFIDSSHEYQDTIEEILLWLPKLKSDGLLCGHDYGNPYFPGLKKAVEELCFGFANPVDSIWSLPVDKLEADSIILIKKLGEYQNNLFLLQQQLQELQDTKNNLVHQLSEDLQKSQQSVTSLTEKINELQSNHALSNHNYQQQIQSLTEELEAMKTSKFWKLRLLWFKIKQKFGLLTD